MACPSLPVAATGSLAHLGLTAALRGSPLLQAVWQQGTSDSASEVAHREFWEALGLRTQLACEVPGPALQVTGVFCLRQTVGLDCKKTVI